METIFIMVMRFLRWLSPENFQRTALNLIKINAQVLMNQNDKKIINEGLKSTQATFSMLMPRENQEYVFLFAIPPIDLRMKKYRGMQ